jgi:hypothetical protein
MRSLKAWSATTLAGVAGLAGLGLAAPSNGWTAPDPAPRLTSTCAADDPVPTPKDYLGWDRSAPVAWEAIEQYGGIVPEIEEDRSHAPPAWWRYPSALRSAEILAAEAREKDGRGLYSAVLPGDLKKGDLLVRSRGAGACGKMATLGAQVDGQWTTLEAGDDGAPVMRTANPIFFTDGAALRGEVSAFRIQIKKDSTLGHVRELRRDLDHLERTIAERPPLIAKNGGAAVDQKVHDLLDEAWSLGAESAFELDRRELAGRALALAATLDWPGAAVVGAAVLDDVLRRAPLRPDAVVSRAALHLLAGDPGKAVTLAEAATLIPGASPRAQYLLGRSLLAAGQTAPGLAAIKRYLERDPADPRARRLAASNGAEPKLAPPPADAAPGLRLTGTSERGGAECAAYGFRADWPLTWRVVDLSMTPETGVLLDLATGRVLLDDGDTDRGAAVLLVERPESPAARAAMVKKAGRNIFPEAKLKTLPPLIPGSRREQFREKLGGVVHQGEVTTVEHAGTVFFLVLNASAQAYGKLKDEYAGLVKSLTFLPAAAGATH